MQTENNKQYKIYIIGILSGLAVTFIFVLIFAAIMLLCGLNKEFAEPFATVSLACGGFSTAYIIAFKKGSRGYLIGAVSGAVIFTVITIIGIIAGNSVTLNTLFHFIIITFSAILGGITAVNRENGKKYTV